MRSPALSVHLDRKPASGEPDPRAWTDMLRTLRAAAELTRIAGLLETGGVRYLAFKGPTLALLAYGDVGARQFGDLDVLVHPDDLATANELLVQRGYERADAVPDRLVSALRRRTGHWRLVHPDRGLVVEPHWRILKPGLAPGLDVDAFWTRTQTVTLGGRPIPTLGNEDLTLYLALHGYFHRWERTKWLEDLHRMIEQHPELDWAAIVGRAERGGVRPALFAALSVSQRVFGTSLPRHVLEALWDHAEAQSIADDVMDDFRTGRMIPKEGLRRTLVVTAFRVRGHERWLDRLRVGSSILAPQPTDLRFVSLPSPLHPLYYAVRPVRIAMEQAGKALGIETARERRRTVAPSKQNGQGGTSSSEGRPRGDKETGDMVKKTNMTERLRAFAEAHPEGWNHDEWLRLLDDLSRSEEETAEADLVGKQLEEMRLAGKLRQSGVSGLGPKRIEALVNRFGDVWSFKQASVEAVAEIPTIPRTLAERVVRSVD